MKKFLKISGLVLVGLVLLYLLWGAFWLWYRSAEDEVFVLPNDFEGCVIVLFGEENGEPKEYNDNGDRVYRIPKNGVLKTQFKHKEGWRDVKYLRKNGQKIRYLWPSDIVWKDTINGKSPYKDSIYVFMGRSSIGAIWFNIGHPQDSEYWADKMEEKWKPYSKPIIYGKGAYEGIIWSSGKKE